MTSGYILIAAILLLGGLIAALGDRLGSKVGKARLRLFNLRPKQTAVVVTVLTGTLIASSTLGIIFALSKSLRQGVFELDDILEKRRQVKQELLKVTEEKNQIEDKLAKAREKQIEATETLAEINVSYQASLKKLKNASNQANSLKKDVKSLLIQRLELVKTKEQLNLEVGQLRQKLEQQSQQLNSQKKQISLQDQILKDKENQQKILAGEIKKRDTTISNLDRAISSKDEDLRGKETRVKQLESQLASIKKELDVLDQYYQTYQELREKRIVLGRGQVLAFGTVKVVEPKAAVEAIDYLLSEANRNAIKAISPTENIEGSTSRVVKITKAQVELLAGQIKDGRDYVITIVSAGNYVQGEEEVRVFADVRLNQEVFPEDIQIATVSIDIEQNSQEELQKRLDLLLSAAQFRARSAGIVGDIQVEGGSITTISDFITQLKNANGPVEELRAITMETTYTSGPLKLRLVAISKGKIIFSTSAT